MNDFPYQYHAFGLNICSELELPSLMPTENIDLADVTIRCGEVSATGLESPQKSTPFFQTAKENLWLHVPEIARFLVTNGNSITI